jgi:hypothetical protein
MRETQSYARTTSTQNHTALSGIVSLSVCLVQKIYSKEQLRRLGAADSGTPMIAIVGEVYDVSSALQYYGTLHRWVACKHIEW